MDNETIILDVSFESEVIKIRIDRNGLAKPDFGPHPVTLLELESCRYEPEFQKTLSDSVSKHIDYEVLQTEGGLQVSFWLDYHVDEFEVICAQFHTSDSEYTYKELMRKCERLAGSYLDERRNAEINALLFHTLHDRIQSYAKQEIDGCKRKIDFFRDRDPEKSNKYIEIMRFSQKMLTLTDLVDQ